jgi:hypothetical protein
VSQPVPGPGRLPRTHVAAAPVRIEVIVDIAPDYAAFGLLEASWDAGEFLRVITDSLVDAQRHGAFTTWVLCGHDADLRRTRAAALLMLALAGSACLSHGEELGMHEVAEASDIPAGLIEAQEHDPASTLSPYRQALAWRRKLQAVDHLEWMPGTGGQVLHFGRPGGWRSVTNFGPRAVPLPPGTVVVASTPLEGACCPRTPPPGSSPAARPGPRRSPHRPRGHTYHSERTRLAARGQLACGLRASWLARGSGGSAGTAAGSVAASSVPRRRRLLQAAAEGEAGKPVEVLRHGKELRICQGRVGQTGWVEMITWSGS